MLELSVVIEEIKQSYWPFYIYVLYRPNGVPFYVGKGKARNGKGDSRDTKDQRIAYHEQEARSNYKWKNNRHANKHKLNTIRQIWRQGKQVLYAIDSWHNTEEAVLNRENELIKSIGRRITGDGPLTNLTEGGEKEAATITEETRRQISESLKRYYAEHPDRLAQLSEQRKKWVDDNPEEAARIFSQGGKRGCKFLINWMHTNPEGIEARNKKHSEFMTEWHQNNREKTKEIAAKRNEKFRSPEHRQHMAEATRRYILENPEADKKRREKVRVKFAERTELRKRCLELQKPGDIVPDSKASLEKWQSFYDMLSSRNEDFAC